MHSTLCYEPHRPAPSSRRSHREPHGVLYATQGRGLLFLHGPSAKPRRPPLLRDALSPSTGRVPATEPGMGLLATTGRSATRQSRGARGTSGCGIPSTTSGPPGATLETIPVPVSRTGPRSRSPTRPPPLPRPNTGRPLATSSPPNATPAASTSAKTSSGEESTEPNDGTRTETGRPARAAPTEIRAAAPGRTSLSQTRTCASLGLPPPSRRVRARRPSSTPNLNGSTARTWSVALNT